MSKLIYFVDDDKMILNLLEYTFSSRDGYHVSSFRRGEDCLDAIDQNPNLIILDHSFMLNNSSYSSGLEILSKLRERKYENPVIVLSGEQDEEVINAYKSHGVDKFIKKDSFFIDSLIESINSLFKENNN